MEQDPFATSNNENKPPETDLDKLIKQLKVPTSGLEIKDRTWYFKRYPKCFVGKELVDWLVAKNCAKNRKEAVTLGNYMLNRKIFHHVMKDHAFSDENLFYRFTEDDPAYIPPVEPTKWADIPTDKMDAANELLGQLGLAPLDEFNQQLLDNVHPYDWQDPEPLDKYGLVVIGGGAAGLVSAAGAAGLGFSVALIEKNMLGGDCLNVGCVPSKALLKCASIVKSIKTASDYGIYVDGEVNVDFGKVMERMRRLRSKLSWDDSAKRFRELGVDVFIGKAKFASKNSVVVNGKTLKFHKAVVATGARPTAPPIVGLDKTLYLTNETIFNLTKLPKRLAIIGGGPIGCELAQAFSRFGSRVIIFEVMNRIMIREHESAAKIVHRSLIADGVRIVTGVIIDNIVENFGIKTIFWKDGENGSTIDVDEILVATGRAPNVQDMELEKADVKYDKRKGVTVNDQMQTSNPLVYSCGDVCQLYKFTHTADAGARIVIRNALFGGKSKLSDLIIPWCTYTQPEVAHVGLYQKEAEEKGIKTDKYLVDMKDIHRAVLESDVGFVEVLTAKGTDKILGATIVSSNAGDMISEYSVMMNGKIGLGVLANTIHPYPTRSEAIKRTGDMYNKTRLTPMVKMVMRKLYVV